jgi:hypothetical protein
VAANTEPSSIYTGNKTGGVLLGQMYQLLCLLSLLLLDVCVKVINVIIIPSELLTEQIWCQSLSLL